MFSLFKKATPKEPGAMRVVLKFGGKVMLDRTDDYVVVIREARNFLGGARPVPEQVAISIRAAYNGDPRGFEIHPRQKALQILDAEGNVVPLHS